MKDILKFTTFRLLECSAGVPPASLSHSVSREVPGPHMHPGKSTSFETLAMRRR